MIARLRQWLTAHARHWIALAAHHSGADALYRRLSGPGLVVLMLHRLSDRPDPWPLSTSPASFARMLGWLRRRDALVGLEQGLRALDTTHHGATRYAITFDDGYRDNLRLVDAGIAPVPAVVYVATAHMGGEPIWIYRILHSVEARTRDHIDLGLLGLGQFDLSSEFDRERFYRLLPPRLKQLGPAALEQWVGAIVAQAKPRPRDTDQQEMLDWNDVRQLEADGVEIGAHTRHHVLLAQADGATAGKEIASSRDDLALQLRAAPAHFAYPNGGAADFGERDVAMVRAAGFRTAVTSIEGVNRRGVDPYRILRHNVHEQRYRAPSGRLSEALFLSETSGLLGWLRERRAA
jgi:peptidoglycan/xylan/chitin deacetylase (PgdA/CDA1 family)